MSLPSLVMGIGPISAIAGASTLNLYKRSFLWFRDAASNSLCVDARDAYRLGLPSFERLSR